MLPARRWKRPLQLFTCGVATNGDSFPTANKCLFANLLFCTAGEGDEATSPSFAAKKQGIEASIMLLEALNATCKYKGIAHGSSLPTANKYLFAKLLFFMSGEGEETTSPSFTTCYVAIEGSSALLEVLIASVLSACGTAMEATFPTAINLLIAVGLLFSCADGERTTPPSCASIGAYNTPLLACISSSKRDKHFLPMGILTFPGGRQAHFGVLRADISSFSLRSICPSRSGYIRVDAPFWI